MESALIQRLGEGDSPDTKVGAPSVAQGENKRGHALIIFRN